MTPTEALRKFIGSLDRVDLAIRQGVNKDTAIADEVARVGNAEGWKQPDKQAYQGAIYSAIDLDVWIVNRARSGN